MDKVKWITWCNYSTALLWLECLCVCVCVCVCVCAGTEGKCDLLSRLSPDWLIFNYVKRGKLKGGRKRRTISIITPPVYGLAWEKWHWKEWHWIHRRAETESVSTLPLFLSLSLSLSLYVSLDTQKHWMVKCNAWHTNECCIRLRFHMLVHCWTWTINWISQSNNGLAHVKEKSWFLYNKHNTFIIHLQVPLENTHTRTNTDRQTKLPWISFALVWLKFSYTHTLEEKWRKSKRITKF